MWTLACRLAIQSDELIATSTTTLPIVKGCVFYTWKDPFALDGYTLRDNAFRLTFFMTTGEQEIPLVGCTDVPVGRLNYGQSEDSILKIDNVAEMSYRAVKYQEDDNRIGQLVVSSIGLKIDDQIIQKLIAKPGNKLTCYCNNDIYLGRSQELRKQVYRWFPSNSAPPLTPEEELDLGVIRGTCKKTFQFISDETEGTRNLTALRLPETLHKDGFKGLQLQFYNLPNAVAIVDCTFQWVDFQSRRRPSAVSIVTRNCVQIAFYMPTEHVIKLVSISFHLT
jgi:hypothetical protein